MRAEPRSAAIGHEPATLGRAAPAIVRLGPATRLARQSGAVAALFDADSGASEKDFLGTAFRVAAGLFATARRVVEGRGTVRIRAGVGGEETGIVLGHPEPGTDMALVVSSGPRRIAPAIALGGLFDDRIAEAVRGPAMVLGCLAGPGAPRAAIGVEVCGVILATPDGTPRLLLSRKLDRGFAGAAVLSPSGRLLGLVSEPAGEPVAEATTVEPIYECLAFHRRLPAPGRPGPGRRRT